MVALLFQEGLEVAAEEVGAACGGAREGREDAVVVLPEGTRGEPFFVLADRWRPRASVAFWEHFMERPLPFLGFSKVGPVLVWLRGEHYVERGGGSAGVYVVPF